MKNYSYFVVILLFLNCLLSCTNHSESDLIDISPPEPEPTLITYNTNVKIIIDNNCISCHTDPPKNGAPMSLLSYEQVKEAVENRGLIERISSDVPFFMMPFGGPKLPQNLINIIIQWETDGLLESN